MGQVTIPPAEWQPAEPSPAARLLVLLVMALLALLVGGFIGYQIVSGRVTATPITLPLDPQADPVQGNVPAGATPISHQTPLYGWTLTPKASYTITARVIQAKNYPLDWRLMPSPTDFALGWGNMSDPAADEWLRWSQSGRWYFYRYNLDMPYTADYVKDHSANVHLIPATPNLNNALSHIEEGEIVLLEGLLVDVDSHLGDFQYWSATSLSRTDSGAGGCEILYIQRLVANGLEYR